MMRTRHSLPALAAVFLPLLLLGCLSQPAFSQVTIEIVNDSGRSDTNVFIKVPGKLWADDNTAPVTPADLFVNITNTTVSAAAATALPLSFLGANGSAPVYPAVSTISGRTNTVYSFQADAVDSGSIYFIYDQPYTFTNGLQPSPPPDSLGNAYRYDYAELSVNDVSAQNNAVDVTYVDKFGIPLQLEWFHGSNLVAGSYVYVSTKNLVEQFSDAGFASAVFSLNASNITAGWSYAGPDSYTNFARILAPQKVSGTNSSVAPYPSITNYLNSLVGTPHAFWLNGASPQDGFYYVGYQASIDTMPGGWTVTLAQTTNLPAFNSSDITGVAYTNTITFAISNANAGQYIYGSPVGPNFYSVNGTPVTTDTGGTYSVETWMIGDVLSAINYGFWGGRYGTNSADWYSVVEWTAFPFGSARPTMDGFYNPYAALIYNNTDPYSYAFSERITPDVLMSPGNGDRIRITILPDNRLDSPVVQAPANITSNSITLNWGAVAGATGYQVNVIRPLNIPSVAVSANATSCTLTNLLPGLPYVMSVQAMGAGLGGNPIITPARQVHATTLGAYTPTNGNFTQIQVSFGAKDPFYQLGSVFINGAELTTTNWQSGATIICQVSQGTNQFPVKVLDRNGNVVFNDWLQFVLATPFEFTSIGTNSSGASHSFLTTNSAISGLFLSGQKLSQPAPEATGGWPTGNGDIGPIAGYGVMYVTNYTGSETNFIVNPANESLTIGLSYVPAETRKYAPVGSSTPAVAITDVQLLSGGGVQFAFDVPAGTPYSIEASENLITWQTVSSGTGQAGGETYSDPGTTGSGTRFYRIKL